MNNPTSESLNIALKDHFASKSLSENQVNDLLALQANTTESDLQIRSNSSWWKNLLPSSKNYRLAFYSTALMLFGALFTVYNLLDKTTTSQRIMTEIVYNHNQQMPSEIASSSISDISKYLNKLSFSMSLPEVLSASNWQLLGGRYCTISGKLAAQLKVKNLNNNKTYTFYQAAINKDLEKSDFKMTDTIDGVGVSIWREHGLLQGLAEDNL